MTLDTDTKHTEVWAHTRRYDTALWIQLQILYSQPIKYPIVIMLSLYQLYIFSIIVHV